MLSQEQIDSYHENGYLTVENVLSADELDALQRVTDEFIDRQARTFSCRAWSVSITMSLI